jgi:glycosyltransferase involved in cell wall biosynthesis
VSAGSRELVRRIGVISYYANPDVAIGGRRPSALVEYLAARGCDAMLFTSVSQAIEGAAVSGFKSDAFMRLVVPDRRLGGRAVSAFAAWYRALRNWRREAGAPAFASESTRGTDASTWKERLYEVLDVVDNRKSWSFALFRALLRENRRRRFDVFVVSGPPFSPFVAAIAAGRLTGVPVVLDFRDPWCDDGGEPPRLITRLRWRFERAMERTCTRRASRIVTTTRFVSSDISARWLLSEERLTAIPNGYDADAVIPESAPVGRVSMLFAGTIYLNRSPMNFLDALRALVERPDVDRSLVSMRFVGDCESWRGVPMRQILIDKKIDDVVVVGGPEGRSRVLELTKASNILINLAQGQRKQVPGKLFEQIAANRAVLLITESDSASALAAEGSPSVVVTEDNQDQILFRLRGLYDALVNRRDVSVTRSPGSDQFSRKASNKKFAQILGCE